ncbi:MAG: hypothetical protein ACTHJT_02625 [Cytophaga sp.]|uniref:hypothetical protein n=1 Tax=Cytophaga sp. TaxID=29535 RepID=UPI003F7FC99F
MRNSLVILIALISSCTKINQAKMNQNKNEYIFYKMVNDNSKYDYRHHEIDFSLKDSVLLKEVFEKAKQIHFSGYKNENPIEDSIQYDGFDFCQFKPENNKNKYKAFLDKDGKIISMTQVENSPNFGSVTDYLFYKNKRLTC